MRFSQKAYEYAKATLSDMRSAAQAAADERKSKVYAKLPELSQIDRRLQSVGIRVAMAVAGGSDAKAAINEIKGETKKLYARRDELLKSLGLTEADLEPKYACPICNDTGENGLKLCDCYMKLVREYEYKKLNDETPLSLSGFEDFKLSYYKDGTQAEHMKDLYDFCTEYADEFDMSAQNLLMYGKSGLGKTHLSLAIAGEVIKKGYGVVYTSAQNIFRKLEKERFTNDYQTDTENTLIECDLLILDDLGTEFKTSFSESVFYNILNTRLLKGHPTVISTNLMPDELGSKYHERIVSRLKGNFEPLYFIGEDIRQKKYME